MVYTLQTPQYLGPLYTRSQANVPPKSSIPIGAKVEISPKGFTLGVKAEIEKKNSICPNFMALYWPKGWKKDTIQFGKPICNPKMLKVGPKYFGPRTPSVKRALHKAKTKKSKSLIEVFFYKVDNYHLILSTYLVIIISNSHCSLFP